jgi:hypothetical protein
LGLVTLTSLALVSCGGDSPLAPSGTAIIEGTVNAGAAVAAMSTHTSSAGRAAATIQVAVVGINISTIADSSGHFVLTGVPTGPVTLRFQGPGIDANLGISSLAAGQTLTIAVQASGNTATLLSSPSASPTSSPSPSLSPSPSPSPKAQKCFDVGEKAEVEGIITSKSGGGAGSSVGGGTAQAVTLGSITVFQQGAVKGDYVCQVSDTTRIRHGNTAMTFAQLEVGNRVHVAGSGLGSPNGMCKVMADEVMVQQP